MNLNEAAEIVIDLVNCYTPDGRMDVRVSHLASGVTIASPTYDMMFVVSTYNGALHFSYYSVSNPEEHNFAYELNDDSAYLVMRVGQAMQIGQELIAEHFAQSVVTGAPGEAIAA